MSGQETADRQMMKYVNSAIAVLFMLFFRFLPAPAPMDLCLVHSQPNLAKHLGADFIRIDGILYSAGSVCDSCWQ